MLRNALYESVSQHISASIFPKTLTQSAFWGKSAQFSQKSSKEVGVEKVKPQTLFRPSTSLRAEQRLGFQAESRLPYNSRVTALFNRVRYRVFVERRALRDSQQKLWFYLSAKHCISRTRY